MVGEPHDGIFAERPADRVFGRQPRFLVDDDEDFLEPLSSGIRFRPAGERLRNGVHSDYAPLLIGGYDRIADARERDPETLRGLRSSDSLFAGTPCAQEQRNHRQQRQARDHDARGQCYAITPQRARRACCQQRSLALFHPSDDGPHGIHRTLADVGLHQGLGRGQARDAALLDGARKLRQLCVCQRGQAVEILLLRGIVRGQRAHTGKVG